MGASYPHDLIFSKIFGAIEYRSFISSKVSAGEGTRSPLVVTRCRKAGEEVFPSSESPSLRFLFCPICSSALSSSLENCVVLVSCGIFSLDPRAYLKKSREAGSSPLD